MIITASGHGVAESEKIKDDKNVNVNGKTM
jgi:hypothetical protein